jgi:hypothetical protein
MVDPADLPSVSGETACANCDGAIERGYLPASGDGSDWSLDSAAAVCDTCGWRDVGATGCAPTLGDFESGDLLVRIEREDGALVPAAVTDTA